MVAEHRDKSLGLNENRYRRPDRQPTCNAQQQVQSRYATKEGTSTNRRMQPTWPSIHSDFQQQDRISRVNIENPKHLDQRQKTTTTVSQIILRTIINKNSIRSMATSNQKFI